MDKRIFTAVKIHPVPRFIEIFNAIKKELSAEKITWVDPGVMHLTLKFFGDTPEEEIPEITQALTLAVAQSEPLMLHISGTGFFGKMRDPRVIWFGIETADKLINLELKVRKALSDLGYRPEKDVFKPHLTIGRVKQPVNTVIFSKVIDQYKNTKIQQTAIEELVLYESILQPQGPQYNALSRMKLGGNDYKL